MTSPRQILPGAIVHITRRCVQRQFLLTPDKDTNEIFEYCLGYAAERYGIELIAWQVMSNHYHAIVHDPHGRLPEFIACLHKFVAKCLNRRRDRWENVWSIEETCLTRLIERPDVLAAVVYALSNPVAANLVDRAADWIGSSSLPLMAGGSKTVKRPKYYFAKTVKNGIYPNVMPEYVTLKTTPPYGLTPKLHAQWLETVHAEIGRNERLARAERRRTKSDVTDVIRRWKHVPKKATKHRKLRPCIACLNEDVREAAIKELQDFRRKHRDVRDAYVRGDFSQKFPVGTYRKIVWTARRGPDRT